MSWSNSLALLTAMLVLAAMPSVSVLIVSARAASAGFMHGAFAALGIVVGDIILICLAIYGLGLLAAQLGDLFWLIKSLGGLYLIGLGVLLWRSTPPQPDVKVLLNEAVFSSFIIGLLVTLADIKALIFYLGFLPAFVDLSNIAVLDISIIIGVTIIAVGGVKLIYAWLAAKTGAYFGNRTAQRRINQLAGTIMLGIGVFLLLNSA